MPREARARSAEAVAGDEVLQFMRSLWAVAHALRKTSKRMSRELGITGPQRLVVRVLGLSPGMSAGEMADVLHLHPSTLTGVLRRLVSSGLVRRQADPADARRSVLALTARGQRLNVPTAGTVEASVRGALQRISADNRGVAAEVLSLVAARLSAAGAAPARAVPEPGRPGGASSRRRRRR